ncbi:MAG: hypothetical protein PHN26_02585 [Eubacteriaceae bacterium]|nr:hypothetical protein [Eubacteriaceae bacterium]
MIILIGACGTVLFLRMNNGFTKKIESANVSKRIAQTDYQSDPQSGYARLSDEEKSIYAILVQSTDNFESHIDLNGLNITVDGLTRIWQAFYQDNPQYFWFNSYSYEYDPGSNIINSMDLSYTCDKATRDQKQSEIDKKVAAIEAQIPEDADEYTVVKTVHDLIISETKYGYASADNQNIASVFIDGESVCAGYSKAMEYILKDMGLFCTVVDGQAKDRGAHEWNLVKMNDQYYYVDVTWDDPGFADADDHENCIEYTFFGITTDELLINHTIDDPLGGIAQCTATENNYFVHEGKLFGADGMRDFITGLKQSIARGDKDYCARFSSSDLLDTAVLTMSNTDLSGYTTVSYIRHDDMGVITVLLN